MTDLHVALERAGDEFSTPAISIDDVYARKERRKRRQRVAASVVGLLLFALLISMATLASIHRGGPLPAVPSPTMAPARPATVFRLNGEQLSIDNDRLIGTVPRTGRARTLATCHDPCVFFSDVAWSPSGAWLTYGVNTCLAASPCESQAGLWIRGATGPARQLFQACDPAWSPPCEYASWAWSPVVDELAVVRSTADETRLVLMEPDGTSRALVSPDGPPSLAWSPDGSTLALSESDGIQLLDPRSGTMIGLTSGGGAIGTVSWSPDGTRLTIDGSQDGRARIWILGADGSGPRLLVDGPGFEGPGQPVWSPDGTRIAYLATPGRPSHYGVEYWTVAPDGSHRVRVWSSGCCIGNFGAVSWSPDGSRIVFTVDSTTYRARADGAGIATPSG